MRKLPEEFADLERFTDWCLPTEEERYQKRLTSTMAEMQEFYDAAFPRLEAVMEYCDARFPLDGMPDVRSLRIPLKYLANLLTAGDEEPIAAALERMLAMRSYMRAKSVEGRIDESIPQRVGLTRARIEEMYKIMALAAYEDRYVIPTARREFDEDAYVLRGSSGFGFGETTRGTNKVNLFGGTKRSPRQPHMKVST